MTDKMHLEGDIKNGDVVETLHFDETEKVFHHQLQQDVSDTLEYVKNAVNTDGKQAGKSKSGEWYHAARVDMVVVHAWLNARNLKMKDFKDDILKQFLNDPDHKAFRIYQGNI